MIFPIAVVGVVVVQVVVQVASAAGLLVVVVVLEAAGLVLAWRRLPLERAGPVA